MENNCNQNKGPYISDYFRVIFGRKLLFTIITVIITILLTLILYFGVSKPGKKYSITFQYSNQELNEDVNYKSLVSKDYLNQIKNSDEKFENIDIEKLLEKNDISILINKDESTNEITYTLEFKKSYIDNNELAKDFVTKLLSYPIESKVEKCKVNYQENLSFINNSFKLENKVKYLEEQYEILNNAYSKIIENFSDSVDTNIYKEIVESKNEFNNIFLNVDFASLKNTIEANGYIENFTTYKTQLLQELNSNIINYNNITEKINKFDNNQSVIYTTEYFNLVDTLINSKTEIKSIILKFMSNNVKIDDLIELTDIESIYTTAELETMYGQIDTTLYEETINNINNLINNIENYTNIVTGLEGDCWNQVSISYNNTNIIKITGGISGALIIILSFVIGVVIAGCVILFIDRKKLIKII